jgi:hypothetical protein
LEIIGTWQSLGNRFQDDNFKPSAGRANSNTPGTEQQVKKSRYHFPKKLAAKVRPRQRPKWLVHGEGTSASAF